MFYKFICGLAHLLAVICFRMRYEGLENIPEDGKFIICSNHRSYVDPVFLVIKVKQPIKFMAKAELFENAFLRWFFTKLGAFPVSRGSGDTEPLKIAIESLKNGSPLLIFPEGTRSKTGKPKRARSGLALIAGEAQVGVLPVSIDYGEKLRFRTKVTLKFHPVITVEELNINLDEPRTLRKASATVMDTIVSGLTQLPDFSKENKEDAA